MLFHFRILGKDRMALFSFIQSVNTMLGSENPQAKVKTIFAFPYNPYHPEPYYRFTEVNMMDYPNDFLVGEDYWNFLGGKGTFPELLRIFDEVRKAFKEKLQKKFQEIAATKIDSY